MTKAPYDVRLTQLDDGSVLVTVGCKVLSYRHDDPQLAADVVEYFRDPGGMVRRFSAAFGWAIESPEQPAQANAKYEYERGVMGGRIGVAPRIEDRAARA